MSWKRSDRVNERGAYDFTWETTRGIDVRSGDTKLLPDHVPYIQNMHLAVGVPTGANGYSLLDTTMDATDNATPMGAGQLIQRDATETYVQIQADGIVNRWNATTNAWVNLFGQQGSNVWFTASERWNTVAFLDKLIFCNPTDGNWKYEVDPTRGSNFLPLGARIISDCESDHDGQWAGETAESTVVIEGEQSYSSGAIAALGNTTLTFTPTTNLDLTDALDQSVAYSEANATIGFFIRITDASEFDEAASYIRIQTSAGNRLDEFANEWIDHSTNAAVSFADNTWVRIEIPLDAMAETGTFNLADVDLISFYLENDGAAATTVYLDCVYIIYDRADRMPGCRTMTVWNSVLIGAGATFVSGTADPAEIYYTDANAPDEFNTLAALQVSSGHGGGIRVVRRYFNQVFVGKEGSCHSLGGSIAGTVYPHFQWEVLDVTFEHGADGHRACVEADKKLYFTWRKQWYQYDGTGTTEIGDTVFTDMDDHEETRLEQKSLVHWPPRDEIWLTYPGNGDTNNVKRARYNIKNRGFVESVDSSVALAVNFMFYAEESSLPVLVGIDSAGDWMRMDDSSATDFDGTAITRIFRLPWLGNGEILTYWTDLTALFGNVTTGTITVEYRIADHPKLFDGASFVSAGTVDTDDLAEGGWVQIHEISRWVQVQFTASAVNFDLQYPITLEGVPVGRWA